MSKASRNDPCPCGSGKKYKKCCLTRDEAARPRMAAPEREEHYIAELRPDLDDAVDRVLQKLELGAGSRVEAEIAGLLEEYPEYHMTQYAMGVYLATVEKDAAGAIPYFERAVKILPPFSSAHFDLGMAARQTLDIPKAVAAFQAAERYSDPEDGIGEMARKELQWLEKVALKGTPFLTLDAYVANARLFDRAFECLEERQFEQAVELFQRVLQENPRSIQSYGNMALAYAGLGRKAEAMKCFDRALELDPGYQPAISNRLVTSNMREGEPFVLPVQEVRYYAEKIRRSKI
jgi:tetratricopeptide (TPR) repeat protein